MFYNWPETSNELSRSKNLSQQPAFVVGDAASNSNPVTSFAAAEPLVSPADLLQRVEKGDEYFKVGNFPFAIRYFTPVYELFPHDVAMLLRLGLAHEKNNQPEHANYFYRKAEIERGSNLNRQLAAALGIIRCNRQLGKANDAARWLTEYFLEFADAQIIDEELRFELGYQLAILWRDATLRDIGHKLGDLESLQFEECEVKVDTMLPLFGSPQFEGEFATEAESPQRNASGSFDLRELALIQRPSDDVKLMVVSARTRTLPVLDLLRQLGDVTAVTISPSAETTPYPVSYTHLTLPTKRIV